MKFYILILDIVMEGTVSQNLIYVLHFILYNLENKVSKKRKKLPVFSYKIDTKL